MRVDELERELRADRMEPDSEFARELDEWAAAGFPRRREPGALERLRARFASVPPRRTLLRVGAVATAVVVAGVGISRIDLAEQSADSSSSSTAVSEDAGSSTVPPVKSVPGRPGEATSGSSASDEYELAPSVPGVAPRSAAEDRIRLDSSAGTGTVKVNRPRIAQKVDLSLSTAPRDFRDAADGVFDVVAAHDGFVITSSVSGGDPGVKGAEPGNASFKLKIPAGELPAALASLSDLGHVVARTDGTEDITGRFIGAKRRIVEYTQARQNLLAQLEDAVTEAEQASIRARLRIVESQLQDAEGDLGSAQQRVHLVPVSVAIAADPAVAGNDEDSDDSGWSLSDALHDAGDVLTVMAGIALVSLAVLLPLGLVGLLLWWGAVRIQRQRRERALDVVG